MESTSFDDLTRLAIIGCGAVTEKKHLPALVRSKKVIVNALVDPIKERVALLGARFNIKNVFTGIDDIEKYADIAIVAVPHHLHASISVSLMERGLDIFVEKPVATSVNEASMMIEMAKKLNRKIGVGLIRRYYSSFEFVKEVLERKWLGDIQAFDFREGGVYNWPAASDTLFRKDTGGGVLFDTGAHTLDILLSWLGNYKHVEYWEDSRSGVDANSLLNLTLENNVKGIVELSRTRNLRNTCIIKGSRGEIEIGVGLNGPVTLRSGTVEFQGIPERKGQARPSVFDLGRLQVERFVDSILNDTEPPVSAESNLETIRLFDSCKKNSNHLSMPWETFSSDFDFTQFNNKKILVLGGTGFIGGRLLEVLAQNSSARIRVLVRDYSRLSGISRYDLDIVRGNMKDRASVSSAIKGCDIVFNCTYGKGSKPEQDLVNVVAVKTLVEEASKFDVRKMVHVSTVSVYGNIPRGILTEESRSRPPKSDVYGCTKLQGEQAALALSTRLNLPLTVIQPTVVYGAGAPSWTLNPINVLKTGQIPLLNGGKGLCNAVYVDDVVLALLLAAANSKASGQTFLISAKNPETWKEFYSAYEKMLGFKSTKIMSVQELMAYRRMQRKKNSTLSQLIKMIQEEYEGNPRIIELPIVAKTRDIVRSIVPRKTIEKTKRQLFTEKSGQDSTSPIQHRPIHMFSDFQIDFYLSQTRVSIEKAERLIDYKPRYNLEEGMRLTKLWATWANIV